MENRYVLDIFTHGIIILVAGSIFGFYLLYKAFKDDEYFFTGNIVLPKWFLIVFGTLLQIPLLIYLTVWIFGGVLKFPVM
ncbi:MAG: hypothetical protein JRI53_01085 [Deltaproteobacteria bacterium]|nr:hypothetical protein [Deltaproteobacteria bacterium]MBW1983286.1 hypothetical protein [Deltaproteobacteria bacterium]